MAGGNTLSGTCQTRSEVCDKTDVSGIDYIQMITKQSNPITGLDRPLRF